MAVWDGELLIKIRPGVKIVDLIIIVAGRLRSSRLFLLAIALLMTTDRRHDA